MKTFLLYPRGWVTFNSPPLGIAYIASYMREKGLEVKLYDATFSKSIDEIMREIKKYNPDIIGFSLLTRLMRDVKETVERIREFNKNIILVAGGPHASVLPEELLNKYGFDVIVTGEGEKVFVSLVNTLEKGLPLEGVKGILFKKDNKIARTGPAPFVEDLDELPFPARDMLPMKKYFNVNMGRTAWTVPQPATTIMAVRGCPYQCTFCSAHIIHGRKLRERSPKNVADEIECLVKEYGIKGLWFNDDSFGINKKWVRELFEELGKRKIKIGWSCNTRVNVIEEDFLKFIKKNGCRLISVGVESGSQHVLDNYLKKGIKLEDAEKAFRLIAKAGILSQASFMLGIPGESLEDMRKTIDFAKKIEPDSILANITVPLPGTEMRELAKRFGSVNLVSWEEMDFMSESVIKTDKFTPEQVRGFQEKFIREFYFRPRYVWTQIKRIRSLKDLRLRVEGFFQLIGSHRIQLFRKSVPDKY